MAAPAAHDVLEDRIAMFGNTSTDDPLVAAQRTREMQVVSDIATDARTAGWRKDALGRGARSIITIPLVYEESMYGVLTVYGRTPQPDERETDVLAELGETIGHAIHTLERAITLRTDSVVELPETADVRELTDGLRRDLSDLTLLSRRTHGSQL